MPKHHPKKKNLTIALGGVALVVLIVLGLASQGLIKLPGMNWIAPGWEIYNAVGGIRYNSVDYTQASQFTTPRDLMGNYWYIDVDNATYGVANLMVELGDINHVDGTGRVTPVTEPAHTITKTIGNNTYELDEHYYTYVMTVRTVADIIKHPGSFLTIPTFEHETSWPYEMYQFSGRTGAFNPPHVGALFTGGVYTKFVIDPWKGPYSFVSPPNASYVLTGAWAGVMNAYVLTKQVGQVTDTWPNVGPSPGGSPITPDGDAMPIESGAIDAGHQAPMYQDVGFGMSAPDAFWDPSVTPDSRLLNRSAVVIYYPMQLEAGAKLSIDIGQTVQDMYPCDVAVQITFRVDVLMSHQFTLQSAIEPPHPSWPSDFFGWSESFWTSLLNGLNPFGFLGPFSPLAWFIVTLVALGFIGMIVLAIFAPWTIPRIFGSARKGYDALRGKG